MDVSVIIPYYKGNKYLDYLLDILEKNNKLFNGTMEVIFVNDYPNDTLNITNNNLDIKVYNNEINQGIHQTRINGLNKANGKYILFLDQDDKISETFIESQYKCIGNNDLCIANGIMEFKDHKCLIYKNKRSQDYLKKQIGFIKVRDLIVSPGQCLIKKESIPEVWKTIIMNVNSADDYFLWLLMIDNKCKFTVNYDVLYTHIYTGKNISGSIDQVHKSNMEMIEILNRHCHNINVKLLKRTINYKYSIKKQGKLIPSLKNIDLFIYTVLYQLFWKGM